MTLNSLTLNGKTYDKFPADRTRGLILPAEITGNAASTISVPMSLISIPLSGYNPSIGDMVLTLDNCLYKITGFTVEEETEYTGKLIRTLSSGSSPNVNTELFDKADLPLDTQSFETVDGVEYYRYHAGATYGFTWNNPHPQKGAVTITARGVSQYGGTGGTRLKTVYDDGTSGPDLYIVVGGESRTVTVTTDENKTLSKITGNYDLEDWVLLDMSVMSVKAEYLVQEEYVLPVATADVLGGIKADPKTEADTQPVRIGADGKLYTAPGGGDTGGDGESTSGNWERVHFFEVPTADTIANDTTNITWIADENNNVYGFELDTNENGEPLNYKSLFFKVRQGGCSGVNTADKSANIYINDVKIGAWAKAQVNLNNRTGKVKIYPNGSGYELEYAGLSAFSDVNNWTSSPMLSNGPSHADGTAGKVDGRIKKIKLEFSPEYYIPGGYLVGIWGLK